MAALGSSLASSEGMGAAAGVTLGAEAGVDAVAGIVAAGAAVDVEPESCKGGLGGSEAGGVAAVEGLAFQKNKSLLIVKTLKTKRGVKFAVDMFTVSSHLRHHHDNKILLINFVLLNRCVILEDFSSIYQLLTGYRKIIFSSFCFDLLFQGLHLIVQ